MTRLRWMGALGVCVAISWCPHHSTQTAVAAGQSPDSEPRQSPQLIPRSREERELRFQVEHRIILNVQVTEASGKSVKGLRKRDFTLLEDQKPHALATFREVDGPSSTAPTHAIVLLDTVNNSSGNITRISRGIEQYLKQSQAPLYLPMAIAVLSDAGAWASNSSRNRNVLLGELKDLTSHRQAGNCADEDQPNEEFLNIWMHGPVTSDSSARNLRCQNQRFTESVSALEDMTRQQVNIPGRVILIWIGTGWPLLYSKEFRPDDEQFKRNNFANVVSIANALREAQVTLDMLSPHDMFHKAVQLNDHDIAFLNGVPNMNEVTAGSLSLQALAHQSGGQLLIETNNIPTGIATCIADAESYYAFAFDSAAAAAPDEYHSLVVKVDIPGLTVRTNTLFYAEQ